MFELPLTPVNSNVTYLLWAINLRESEKNYGIISLIQK